VFFTTLPLTLPIAARKDEVGHSANSMGRGGAGEPPQVASPQVSAFLSQIYPCSPSHMAGSNVAATQKKRPFVEAFAEAISDGVWCPDSWGQGKLWSITQV
jgi:hypothetical protein